MGQCSTLPTAEARNETSSSSMKNFTSQERDDRPTAHHRYRAGASPNMTDTSDNSTTPLTARHKANRRPNGYHLQVQTVQQTSKASATSPVAQFNHMQVHTVQPPASNTPKSPAFSTPPPTPKKTPLSPRNYQQREASSSKPQPMQEERELPSPPESAVRTRCYKLNLESEFVGVNSADAHGYVLGPFAETPPPGLTFSLSEDSASSGSVNPTTVAIQTAQIFRGITVAKDGTILSQNARATRSSRGNKMKRGEKSRQAAKIDKAKDLVEETIQTGKAPDSDKDANMVSLVIMGEYDEMRYLVRDGSKKLREASKLPDDALLAINRPRGLSSPVSSFRSPLSPSRKRVSPAHSSSTFSPTKPRSAPPKLKSHPRDRPSSRRLNDNGSRRFLPNDPCNNMFPPQEGDWSGALGLSRGFNSIWNCAGGSGTTSPTQNVNNHPKGYHPTVDSRHDSSRMVSSMPRGRPDTERMEAPSSQHRHAVRA